MQDMASLLAEESMKEFNPHEVIEGTVVLVNRDEAYVDIGYKTEIPIVKKELAYPEPEAATDVVKVGDKINVYVVALGGENGLILSKTRADRLVAWEKVEKVKEEKQIIEVEILQVVKGGLLTTAFGLRGFIPASQIALHFVKDLNEFVGQKVEVEIMEADPKKQRLVLSRRSVLEAQREQKREEALASIVEGEKRTGVVKRLVDYGAFIDIGGVDGLAHISDLSWDHIKNPADVLSVGQEVEVLVKAFDPETKRISLSIKDTVRDPWFDKAEKYPVGSYVKGKIVKLTDFGAFMEIEPGFDGLIRMRELSPKHITKASEAVSVGDEVTVKVIHVDMDNKKVALSITKVQQDAEKAEYQDFLAKQDNTAVTIGDEVNE
ncbi:MULTISPECIES: 30S ribosomal protein S1 [Megamonas]|nr:MULTISPECIES: 30S ribosomal protein S1 [Megamonas]MBE5059272.1 30S ribosomal protein S1 [Megamonas funiformis]RGO06327.1 30S ribosomal protein S1 [Megamonas rupellensis]